MAKKEDKKQAPATAPQNGRQVDPDAGFVSDSGEFGAPFWKVEAGARLKGKLTGAFLMPDQYRNNLPKDIAQVLTTEPTNVSVKGSDETEEVEAGTVVSVGINKRLESLVTKWAPMVDAGAEVHVLLTVTGSRVKTRSGFNVWPIEVRTKVVRPPTRPVIPRQLASSMPATPRAAQAGDEEVPY